jgi:hypothetical protein
LTGNRAFGADDVAGVFSARPKLRKQRFLMTDNTQAQRRFFSGAEIPFF